MTFNEYQKLAKKTAGYPRIGRKFIYPVLGLCGEAGELANKVKKIFRDGGGVVTKKVKKNIKKELGDLLWYVSDVAGTFSVPLEDVAVSNLKKLASRKKRKKVKGSGDNR